MFPHWEQSIPIKGNISQQIVYLMFYFVPMISILWKNGYLCQKI
jgi:hypothetical protein